MDQGFTAGAIDILPGRNHEKEGPMKRLSVAIGFIAALTAGSASAQSVNLTGAWQCIQNCRGDHLAFITQNGPSLNLVSEAGVASRAWPDWYAPASRLWVDAYNISAVYTPDGTAIQFDNGTIWTRYVPPPPRWVK
jgi:hypothetical protein